MKIIIYKHTYKLDIFKPEYYYKFIDGLGYTVLSSSLFTDKQKMIDEHIKLRFPGVVVTEENS